MNDENESARGHISKMITVFPALFTLGVLTLIMIPVFVILGDFASTRFFIIAFGVVLMLDLLGVILKRLAVLEKLIREHNGHP